jgi:hypothetical protein
MSLADILKVEDSSELLDLSCPETGIPVWPQVRGWIIREIMGDLLFLNGAASDTRASRSPARGVVVLGRSIAHNFRLRRSLSVRSPVLVTTEAIADQSIEGCWFNRMADYFAELPGGQAVVLSDQHEWSWPFPRHNANTYLHAPLQVATSLPDRLFVPQRLRRLARDLCDSVAVRARDQLGWSIGETRRKAFECYVARKLATTPRRYRAYERLLDAVRPKILVASSACYGHIATLVAAANDKGIATSEFQHGAISEGHDGYNFASSIRADPRLQRVMPRHFLSYGDWWNERFNAPVAKRTIGYPDRARKLGGIVRSGAAATKVLVLSDGVELELYLQLARELQEGLASTGLSVVLRPHPLERSKALALSSTASVTIDESRDIYEAFVGAHTVISEVSTGLFEAVGLVERIIMLDTLKSRFGYPVHPFHAAAGFAEIAELIMGGSAAPTVSEDELWQTDWQGRYFEFLEEVGAL